MMFLAGLGLGAQAAAAEDWSGFYELEDEKQLVRQALTEEGVFYNYGLTKSADHVWDSMGVWMFHDGKHHYYVKTGVLSSFGVLYGSLTEEGLKLLRYDPLAIFTTSEPMPEVEPFEIPGKPTEAEREQMLEDLRAVVTAELPQTQVTEIETREEFVKQLEDALAAEDLQKLMNMTSVRTDQYETRARTRLREYAGWADSVETVELKIKDKADVLAGLEEMAEAGYTMPENSEPQGVAVLQLKEGTGSGIYFGTINGHWFVLPNPSMAPKE